MQTRGSTERRRNSTIAHWRLGSRRSVQPIPAVGQTLNNLARLYRDQGKYGEAEGLYKRALTIREQTLGPSHPYVAATRHDLAAVASGRGHYEVEEAKAKRVTPAAAQALHSRGLAAWREGKYSEAEELYKRALTIRGAGARCQPLRRGSDPQ